MKCRVFCSGVCGPPRSMEEEINKFLLENEDSIISILQSSEEHNTIITIFYEDKGEK